MSAAPKAGDRVVGTAPSASVLLPTYQAIRYLDRVLAALASQRYGGKWELVVLDCGSTDGTLEMLESWRARLGVPLAVHTLRDVAFDHGDARNRLAALATGDVLVYLTDDAIPASGDWLARLVACFDEPRVAAVYCRNAPRPDARPFARIATSGDPTYAAESRVAELPSRDEWLAMGPEELRRLYAYCDSASALRRSIWERHPYPFSDAGEDVLLARALVDAGHAVRYEADAAVLHTHEWDAERLRRRAYLDGRFNSETFGRLPLENAEDAARFVEAQLEVDAAALRDSGRGLRGAELEAELAHAAEQRRAHFEGLHAGLRRGVRRLGSRVLAAPHVSVVLVRDAATADHAERLRSELVARGHACRVVDADALAPAEPAVGASELVHVLAPLRGVRRTLAEAGLGEAPAIVATEQGWDLLPLGVANDWDPETRLMSRSRLRVPAGATRSYDAVAWESRYRLVLAEAASDVVLDLWARERDRSVGPVVRQGSEALLVGPDPAAVEFDLGPLPGAAWRIEVHVEFAADEHDVLVAGRVEVDGRELARIGPTITEGTERIEVVTIDLPAGSRPRLVRVLNGEVDGGGGHLRLRRIRVVRRDADAAGRALVERLRALRVRHGAPLDEDRLPRVGVVVVTLLGKPLVERCLAALEACDYPADRIELVVVDNDSRSGLAPFLARRHPRARLVVKPCNVGFTQGVWAGVDALESAEIVVLLNDDVVVERAWLRELVSPIARGECAATAARMVLDTGSVEYDGGGGTFQGFTIGTFADLTGPLAPDDDPALHPRRVLFACGGAMAISVEAWRAIGGIDSAYFAYYDDLDLSWRVWISGREVHYVPGAVCTHARSSTSRRMRAASVRRLQVRNALITCIKNYDDANLERLLPALLALAARRTWVLARRRPVPDLELVGRRPKPAWRERIAGNRSTPIDPLAFADVSAVNDVLGSWDAWMARRAEVQATRKRVDAEILRLFGDPLRCVEGEGEYVALQRAFTERLRLEDVFDTPTDRGRIPPY